MEWHGYSQHPDAHPDFPWWHRTACVISGTSGWERHPDRHFVADPAELDERVHSYEDLVAETTPELERIDRDHPLPCPPPRCGQVWAREGMVAVMVVDESPPWFIGTMLMDTMLMLAGDTRTPQEKGLCQWPPPGGILVSGPGSPWMDTREVVP